MDIVYQNAPAFALPAATGWLPGTLNALPGGGYSITQKNGKFLSVQPNGSYQDRDSVGGWETFTIDPGVNVLHVRTWVGDVSIFYGIAFRAI
jgi:hypothetical protein